MNQDKQIELFYSFSRDVEESRDLLEGYRSDIDQLVSGYNLPSGVAVEVFHEEDMFADFKFLLLAAFILIFMILASVFESFVTPFVLLFSIPLAAIGSLLALLLTGNSLLNNANVMIGFLILLGVVVNNGIILIDYANILLPARLSPQQGVDDGWAVTYSPDPNYFHHDDRSHVARWRWVTLSMPERSVHRLPLL